MTDAAMAIPTRWLSYNLKITCTLTAPSVIGSYESFLVPPGSIRVPYALQDVNGTLLTDAVVPPISAFTTPLFSLPGTGGPSITQTIITRSVTIPESAMVGATTMSELMENAGSFPNPDGQIEYDQAFGFTVQLASVYSRAYWRIRPAFVLMVASSGSDIESGQVWIISITLVEDQIDDPISITTLNRRAR